MLILVAPGIRCKRVGRSTYVFWDKSRCQPLPGIQLGARSRSAPARARRKTGRTFRFPAAARYAFDYRCSGTAWWTGIRPAWIRRCCKPSRGARSWCRFPGRRSEILTAAERCSTLEPNYVPHVIHSNRYSAEYLIRYANKDFLYISVQRSNMVFFTWLALKSEKCDENLNVYFTKNLKLGLTVCIIY